MTNRTEYLIGNYKLIWDFNGNDPNHNLNNLYIEDIWNMKQTVGHDEWCVAVSLLSDDTFVFNTFNCLRYTMKINNGMVTLIDKKITK